ncbi:MAG: Dabb family protein [Clostridia bacterium]|nr:Dabb family protein [Clostridia bacterium]
MVKHMIVWKLKDEIKDKEARKQEIKNALEDLVGKIEGLQEMHILTNGFDCSSGDLMMDSTFSSLSALQTYQKHPLHVAIADGLVRPSVSSRLSYDYEI